MFVAFGCVMVGNVGYTGQKVMVAVCLVIYTFDKFCNTEWLDIDLDFP